MSITGQQVMDALRKDGLGYFCQVRSDESGQAECVIVFNMRYVASVGQSLAKHGITYRQEVWTFYITNN